MCSIPNSINNLLTNTISIPLLPFFSSLQFDSILTVIGSIIGGKVLLTGAGSVGLDLDGNPGATRRLSQPTLIRVGQAVGSADGTEELVALTVAV